MNDGRKRETRCHLWLNELEAEELTAGQTEQQRPPSKTSEAPLFTLPVSSPVGVAAMTDRRFNG